MDKIIELEAQLEHCDHTIANLRKDLKRARDECKDSQDRADIAVMLARALSDGLTGDLGPEGPIRKIINRLHAAEALREKLDRAETIADRCITGLGDILAARTTIGVPLTAILALKMGKKWQEKRNE